MIGVAEVVPPPGASCSHCRVRPPTSMVCALTAGAGVGVGAGAGVGAAARAVWTGVAARTNGE